MPGKKDVRARKAPPSKKAAPLAAELDRLTRENRTLRRDLAACRKEGANVEKRVGQLLHDGVCQDLSAAAFYLQGLKNQLARNNPALIAKALEHLSDSLKKAVDSTHRLSQDLRK